MCLPSLPGYAPRGTADRAGQARLTLAELDEAIGTFIRDVYNITPHGETWMPPQQRWEAGAFILRMPDSLEQFDLLLLTVARPRKIHPGRDPLPGAALPGPGAGRLRRRQRSCAGPSAPELARHWPGLHLTAADFTTDEAVAAIARITR